MKVIYDEPALVIRVPDKARQLFPVQRISRVVVTGYVEWSMGALLACAKAGVSVVFMDIKGNILGRWQGKSLSKVRALDSLIHLLQQSTAEVSYDNWFHGMQRMAARSAAKRLSFKDWHTADLVLLDRWAQTNLDKDWLNIQLWLSGVILSAVMQYLAQFGIDESDVFDRNSGFSLAGDIASLLIIDFLPALVGWQRQYIGVPDKPVLLELFRRREQRLEHLLRGALSKLYQSLAERC